MASTDQHALPETRLAPAAPDLPSDPLAHWPELRRVDVRMPLRDYLADLWRRREFAVTVPMGELKARNQDTVLGQVWHLLNPLMLIGIYYLIFQVILNVQSRRGIDYYLPFLIVGLLAYNYTRSSAQTGARMIVKNRRLVQSINFPRAILPLSSVSAETISHLYALPVMFVLVTIVEGGPSPSFRWLLLAPVLVVQATFNLGLSMVVARATFHFRDVQQFMPYLLRLGLYASGVLIPINAEFIPQDTLRYVLQANPVYNIIEMTRNVVLGSPMVPRVWIIGTVSAVVLLVFGFWYFRRAENEYGSV